MKKCTGLIRAAVCLAMLSAVIALCGCFKNKMLVQVGKDGSGHIIITKVFSKDTVDMLNVQMQEMKRYSHDMPAEFKAKADKDPFFDEKALKKQARRFGSSVKFVKARKYDTGGARGYVAVYSFKNINEVALDISKMGQEMERGMYGGMMSSAMGEMDEADMPAEARSENVVEFKFDKGAPNKLEILLPAMPDMDEMRVMMEDEPEEDADEQKSEKDKDTEEDDSREAYMEDMMMSPSYYGAAFEHGYSASRMQSRFLGVGNESEAAARMFKGMQMNVAVEVDGEVTKSSASHVDPAKKNRVLLMEMDADKLMTSPKGKKLLEKSGRHGMSSPERFLPMLNKAPGASMETNREIYIEFK